MKQKFTPGPWRVNKHHADKPDYKTYWVIESDTRRLMAELEVWDINSSQKWQNENPAAVKEYTETLNEVDANAKLMAKAPELAVALMQVQKALANWRDGKDVVFVTRSGQKLSLEEVKYCIVDEVLQSIEQILPYDEME